MVRWSLGLAAAVLFITASQSLVACGGDSDPYSGTWIGPALGPSPDPGASRVQLIIKPANDGWWSIANRPGDTHVLYATKVGGELQLPNGVQRLRVDGDTLTVIVSGLPDHPIIYTRK